MIGMRSCMGRLIFMRIRFYVSAFITICGNWWQMFLRSEIIRMFGLKAVGIMESHKWKYQKDGLFGK